MPWRKSFVLMSDPHTVVTHDWCCPVLPFRMKGYYHMETSKLCERNDVKEHLHKAAQFYEQAALILPEDDEQHACESPSHEENTSCMTNERLQSLPEYSPAPLL
jgi:hypothetical protein